MKKIFSCFLLTILCFCLIGCEPPIKEYKGTKINKLTYATIYYFGGITQEYILDFEKNEYSTAAHSLGYGSSESQIKRTFGEDEEKSFIDACYTYGLFDLEEEYNQPDVIDGGGWTLTIEYADQTTKISHGSNAVPEAIFNKCSVPFYELCGEEVMGLLPENYATPPDVDVSFRYETDNTITSDNSLASIVQVDYLWNKKSSPAQDIFALNETTKGKNHFSSDITYKMIFYTANYHCYKKFKKITIKEYDFNNELTGEKIIHSGRWFRQIELNMNLNKIYVYKLEYSDGDFVRYTFNTYCPDQT